MSQKLIASTMCTALNDRFSDDTVRRLIEIEYVYSAANKEK